MTSTFSPCVLFTFCFGPLTQEALTKEDHVFEPNLFNFVCCFELILRSSRMQRSASHVPFQITYSRLLYLAINIEIEREKIKKKRERGKEISSSELFVRLFCWFLFKFLFRVALNGSGYASETNTHQVDQYLRILHVFEY